MTRGLGYLSRVCPGSLSVRSRLRHMLWLSSVVCMKDTACKQLLTRSKASVASHRRISVSGLVPHVEVNTSALSRTVLKAIRMTASQ